MTNKGQVGEDTVYFFETPKGMVARGGNRRGGTRWEGGGERGGVKFLSSTTFPTLKEGARACLFRFF